MTNFTFFEALDKWADKAHVTHRRDLPYFIDQLETHQMFATAKDIKAWGELFDDYIAQEFDETCLDKPIDCELEGEWLHEYELVDSEWANGIHGHIGNEGYCVCGVYNCSVIWPNGRG